MKDPLVRFGVAIEASLLRQIDQLAGERGCTRSELLRDLGRREVGRAQVAKGARAFATLTLVYDHHVRDLGEKLTELQHQLGDGVRSALHVHLSHDMCLEVIVMQGISDELQSVADRILAMRGVKQGGIEIIADLGNKAPREAEPHQHEHGHGHEHHHEHGHDHDHTHETPGPVGRPARGRTRPRTDRTRPPAGRPRR